MKRKWTAWVGFTDGQPDLDVLRREGGISTDGYCVFYRTRKEARRRYQDVRRVEFRESTGKVPTP